jgi:hypothetical protein
MRGSFLVLGVVAALVAGCGGGGGDGSGDAGAGSDRADAATAPSTRTAAAAPPLKLVLHAAHPSIRLGRSVTLRATASASGDVPLELWSYVPGAAAQARREATATARDGRATFRVRPARTLTYELRADHGRQHAVPELVGVTVPARVTARIGSGGRARYTLRVTVPAGARPNAKAKMYLYVASKGGGRAPLLGPTRLRRAGAGTARATWTSTRITPRDGDRFYACAREAWVEGYGLSDLRDTRCGMDTRTTAEIRALRGV